VCYNIDNERKVINMYQVEVRKTWRSDWELWGCNYPTLNEANEKAQIALDEGNVDVFVSEM
jgi:hypothetical protein